MFSCRLFLLRYSKYAQIETTCKKTITIHTRWLLQETQNYPTILAKRPAKGMLLSRAFMRQPFCIVLEFLMHFALFYCSVYFIIFADFSSRVDYFETDIIQKCTKWLQIGVTSNRLIFGQIFAEF